MNLAQPEQASREKLELALRNSLAMATRMQRRARHPADEAAGSDPWGDIVRFCAEGGVTSNILREASPDSSVSALILRRNFPVPVRFAELRAARDIQFCTGDDSKTAWHLAIKQVTGATDDVYAVVDGGEVRVAVVRDADNFHPIGDFGWGQCDRVEDLLDAAERVGYWELPHEVRLDLVKRESDHA